MKENKMYSVSGKLTEPVWKFIQSYAVLKPAAPHLPGWALVWATFHNPVSPPFNLLWSPLGRSRNLNFFCLWRTFWFYDPRWPLIWATLRTCTPTFQLWDFLTSLGSSVRPLFSSVRSIFDKLCWLWTLLNAHFILFFKIVTVRNSPIQFGTARWQHPGSEIVSGIRISSYCCIILKSI